MTRSRHLAVDTDDNYGIRPDYEARKEALTFETVPGTYWTEERIRRAHLFQHYVYRCAAGILRARPPGQRSVIDVGCGYGLKLMTMVAPVADRIAAIDQPTLAEVVRSAFPELRFMGANLEHALDAQQTYSLVICADVIEHLLNPDPLLITLANLCADDGVIVLSTPERDARRGKDSLKTPNEKHVREWNRQEFSAYLRSRGFEILQHLSLPQKQVSIAEEVVLSVGINVPSYLGSCQLVICRPVSETRRPVPKGARVSMPRLLLERFRTDRVRWSR